MDNDFIILNKIKTFIYSIDNIVINYPKKEMVIKNKLVSDSLEVLELVYKANYTKDIERKREIQIDILSKISMLDFYLEKSYKNKYISQNECIKKCNQLNKIVKMIYGWIKSGNKNQ